MVRALLIAAALALIGCNATPSQQAAVPGDTQTVLAAGDTTANAHAGVACAACHRGHKADVGRASVPRGACTASGCHEDAGPPKVALATAHFDHRNHAVNGDIALSCAGCHTHNDGQAPLRASLDACALCHAEDLVGKKENDCRLCHGQPEHNSLTSQGIPVAHAALPVLETGCARCHYDVQAPRAKVSVEKCSACHTHAPTVTRAGIARDLHPRHSGVQCTSCHEAGLHRIGAMSSAVNLQCADCHSVAHAQQVGAWPLAQTCYRCHSDAHRAQQRLMGLTCRSCHVPPGSMLTGTSARRGTAGACTACHEPEFARVLDWWLTGVRARGQSVGAYVASARRDLGNAPDSSRALLASAEAMLAMVRAAGGEHNIELSDLIFRSSVVNVVDAYRVAGRAAPAPPLLGNKPHVGTCSFCHYSTTENWDFKAMPPGLHERLVKRKQ